MGNKDEKYIEAIANLAEMPITGLEVEMKNEIEELEAELERLKISYNDDMNRWSDCLDKLETALEKIDRLRSLLKQVEWEFTVFLGRDEYAACFFCQERKSIGHKKDCELAKALEE